MDFRPREWQHLANHERSAFHLTILEQMRPNQLEESTAAVSAGSAPTVSTRGYMNMVDNATRTLLNSLSGDSLRADFHMGDDDGLSPDPQLDYPPLEGWGLYQTYGNTQANLSPEEEGTRLLIRSLRDRFDELSLASDDENAERSDPEDDPVAEPTTGGE